MSSKLWPSCCWIAITAFCTLIFVSKNLCDTLESFGVQQKTWACSECTKHFLTKKHHEIQMFPVKIVVAVSWNFVDSFDYKHWKLFPVVTLFGLLFKFKILGVRSTLRGIRQEQSLKFSPVTQTRIYLRLDQLVWFRTCILHDRVRDPLSHSHFQDIQFVVHYSPSEYVTRQPPREIPRGEIRRSKFQGCFCKDRGSFCSSSESDAFTEDEYDDKNDEA